MKLTETMPTRKPMEKVAAKVPLATSPETYPAELLTLLYKQHPFLGNYKVDLNVLGRNDEMGYMYCVFTVQNQQDVPMVEETTRLGEVRRQPIQQQAELPVVKIPVIVASRKAFSFDTFIDTTGKQFPLTETRVTESLFSPNPFRPAPIPQDGQVSDMQGQTQLADNSIGHEQYVKNKLSSPLETLVSEAAARDYIETLARYDEYVDAAKTNAAFMSALTKLAHVKDVAPAKKEDFSIDGAVFFPAKPTEELSMFRMVVTRPERHDVHLTEKQAAALPAYLKQEVISSGYAVMSSKPSSLGMAELVKTAEVTSSGAYHVMHTTGKEAAASVYTDVYTLSGKKLDRVLILGEHADGMQDKVAAVLNKEAQVSRAAVEPRGYGTFVFGNAATEPVTVLSKISDSATTSYIAEHPLLGKFTATMSKVAHPVMANGVCLIPETAKFVSMRDGGKFVADATVLTKLASRKALLNTVTVTELYKDMYELETKEKTASLSRNGLICELSALGDTHFGVEEKLRTLSTVGKVSFTVDVLAGKQKVAAKQVDALATEIARAIRVDLTKEAAVLPDNNTVDTVLSLGFVTPENIMGYLDFIPDLNDTASRLAELLVGIRLGVPDVPEDAVLSAMRGVDRAIEGLKALQMRGTVEEGASPGVSAVPQ